MAKVSKFQCKANLSTRRPITVDLPEFLLRAIEHRLTELNASGDCAEPITVSDVIEHELADGLSIAEVVRLESDVPGITAAVSRWISAASDS